ncbi:hypothetical protein HUK65_14600 [Rhodobacteraceae bacterium 2376]|uniref:Uncharacterized protein n=1 Tax=Rhabdonatronobacter sediminivivens TaxID=2743469 RepID=A0A7Z0I274_9RHOB|nr:hypothetical protein [Rhabdonatronobacter sediminivivens]NYS26222.1 hypothetical protein [Rhabdonatronobacter sediminivivens]
MTQPPQDSPSPDAAPETPPASETPPAPETPASDAAASDAPDAPAPDSAGAAFELTFPAAEAAHLRAAQAGAGVILEYGSGGSTWVAARLPGKMIFSVESDRAWALRLQLALDRARLPSPVVVHHVDIGPTGAWGRPRSDAAWAQFHRYPLDIWDQPFFRHPDLVLIDGRFRAACLASVALRITRPVTVLFDDYTDRPAYHTVERFAQPVRTIGRMAEFALVPGMIGAADLTSVIGFYARASYAGKGSTDYGEPATA